MIAPLLCLLLSANDPSIELTRSTHDLGSIVLRPVADYAAIRSLPLQPAPGDMDDHFDWNECEPIGPDHLVDLLYNTVSPEEWEYEGRQIQIAGPSRHPLLVVDAPAPVQKEVARFLQYIDKALNRRVRMTVDVYHVPAISSSLMPLLGTHDSRTADELRKELPLELRQSFELRLLSGEPAERSQQTLHRYMRDFEVEIAQGAAIHQPQSQSYGVGTVMAIRSEIGSDSRALVTFAIHDAWETQPLQRLAAGSDFMISSEAGIDFTSGPSNLESPSVHFATMAGSARLGVGQTTSVFAALPENAAGPTSGVLAMISVEHIDAEPSAFASGGRELAIRNIAGDASSGYQVQRFTRDALRFPYYEIADNDEDGMLPMNLVISGVSESSGELIEMAMDTAYSYAEDAGMQLGQFGGSAYAIGPVGKATEVLSRVLDGIPTFASLPPVVAEMNVARGPRAAGVSIPLFAVSGATGDAFVVAGTQETYLFSNDVDVANNSSIANPNVDAVVSGYAARIHCAPGFQGTQSLDALLVSQLRQGGKGAFDSGSRQITVLHHPVFLSSVLSATDRASSGDRLSIGSMPIPGESPASGHVHLIVR